MTTKLGFFSLLLLLILFSDCVHGFTNMFGELFSDLRFGTLESDILGQAFPGKLKCAQGSFPFNGSCYFISNKKYIEKDSNEVINYLVHMIEKKSGLQSNIGIGMDKSDLPEKARFEEAKFYCDRLELYSSLIQFNESNAEFDFISNLLKNFTSSQSGKYYEQKYWIGLVYNTTLKWINGMDFKNTDLEDLVKPSNDKYRRCAYLNVRDNGDLIIEWANCINDQHNYICKYVMDRCYNNSFCGRNGACVNIPSRQTFECRCRIFYDGERCEKWSNQGVQMIIAVTIVISAVLFLLISSVHSRINNKILERKERKLHFAKNYQLYVKQDKRKSKSFLNRKSIRYSLQLIEKNFLSIIADLIRKKIKLVTILVLSLVVSVGVLLGISFTRYSIILNRIERYKASSSTEPQKSIDKDNISHMTTFFSFDLCKVMRSQFLEDFILIVISLSLTGIIYFWNAFKCNRNHEHFCRFSKSRVPHSHQDSGLSLDHNEPNTPPTGPLSKLIQLNKLKNFTICGFRCSCGIDFPVPMNPFSKRNRFLTGVIYAAYTYNILKIFEFLLVGEAPARALSHGKQFLKGINITMSSNVSVISSQLNNTFHNATNSFSSIAEQGILMELIKQICVVIIIGLRYYPVLLCIDLKRKSKFCYLLCTIYVLFLLIYYVYMNTFCLLSAYSTIKHAYRVINAERRLPTGLNDIQFPRLLKMNNQTLTTTKSGIKSLRAFSLLDLKRTTSTTFTTGTTTSSQFDIKKNLTTLYGCRCCKKNLDGETPESDDEEDGEVVSRLQSAEKVDNELKYSRELLVRPKPIPFFRHLFGRYLGSATEMSYMVPSNAQINDLISSLYDNISSYIILACCFTTGVYVVQLFLGIRSYHQHVLNGYRGVYEDIPSPKKFSNVKLASSSLHYRITVQIRVV
ncbi:hypothetical protein BpHYR1_042882 [Brachionus plicatilis]|uniref:EGF-like domain-containing protein n=1 Tax=Brachionus plicatilis TaxID=10195 RepID=A0A3M7RK50_BRAPC|nr:hypothetical protein BpHYR1_042882 [Brachionus plicatilis]